MPFVVEDGVGVFTPTFGYGIPVGTDNRIDLTSPTQLTFGTIEWKFKLSHVFKHRALKTWGGADLYPEDTLDTTHGYAMEGSWYIKQGSLDEWLEVHASVDGAWWQLIFTGLGRALFTNGEWIREVVIEPDTYYLVRMSLSPDDDSYTLTLLLDGGEVLAAGNGTASHPLVASDIGASGNFNEDDASLGILQLHPVWDPWTETWITLNGGWGAMGWASGVQDEHQYAKTYEYDGSIRQQWTSGWPGNPGTGWGSTSSHLNAPWTQRPAWSSCGGLDYTWYGAAHYENWWEIRIGTIPEGYENGILRLEPTFNMATYRNYFSGAISYPFSLPQLVSLNWQVTAPEFLGSGMGMGETALDANTVTGRYFWFQMSGHREGDIVWWGAQPRSYARVGHWYCGSGTDWWFARGWYGSWAANTNSPDSWGKVLYAWDSMYANGLRISFDHIRLDGYSLDLGLILEEGWDEAREGWNQEVKNVESGLVSIGATPVRGTVNVYDFPDGNLLDYGPDWEEEDDSGMVFRIHADVEAVSVIYFVTEAQLGNVPMISRPAQIETDVNQDISHRMGF